MSTIIHLESATDVCSVVLAKEGEIIARREIVEDRSHAGVLVPYVNEVFQESGIAPSALDAVAVSMGPGSYTGLRIGVSVAKGLCYGNDVPLLAVSTLEAMAWGMRERLLKEHKLMEDTLLVPMIDARRMEVYTVFYNKDLQAVKDIHALVVDENTFDELLDKQPLVFFGNGSEKFTETIRHANAKFIDGFKLSSTFQVELALKKYQQKAFEDVAYFEPFYLKDFITTTPKKKLF